MSLKNHEECELVKTISKGFCCINVVHFAQSTVLGYHSIPKSNWRSLWDQFRDHFRVEDHFSVRIISGADVQNFAKGCKEIFLLKA